MQHVRVTTTPRNLNTALGGSFVGRLQNRGPSTVYRATAPAATPPVPAQVRGWRHTTGSSFPLRYVGDGEDPLWVWTSSGVADLVVEPGDYE